MSARDYVAWESRGSQALARERAALVLTGIAQMPMLAYAVSCMDPEATSALVAEIHACEDMGDMVRAYPLLWGAALALTDDEMSDVIRSYL